MRCTDCRNSKETIPAQVNYIYCSKFEKEMSTATEFETCQYKETEEYKLKEAISNYCNNENSWIVGVDFVNLLKSLESKFNIPSFVQDIKANYDFRDKVNEVLNDSKMKLEKSTLVTLLDDEGEIREGLLILQRPRR